MLKRTPDFAQMVWEAVKHVGRRAPRIAKNAALRAHGSMAANGSEVTQ